MKIRIIDTVFIVIVALMLLLPTLFISWEDGDKSRTENRVLAYRPAIYKNGEFNCNLVNDLEQWIDDNIGFREQMVSTNNKVFFYLFDMIDIGSFYMLGPNNELNYAPDFIIEDYHHLDLLETEELERIVLNYQCIDEYCRKNGVQFYRVQCWDKHSIYPEQFPRHVLQYGDISKTQQVFDAVESMTDINQPDLKSCLLANKDTYQVYPSWGDPTHWSDRGAFIGYTEIMKCINEGNADKYRILKEDDLYIQDKDTGLTILGGIHQEDINEVFTIANTMNPIEDNSGISLFADDDRSSMWVNEAIDNDDRLLIVGDSYIGSFLMPYFAESFHEVMYFHMIHSNEIFELVNEYSPDILILETAERMYGYKYIDQISVKMGNKDKG